MNAPDSDSGNDSPGAGRSVGARGPAHRAVFFDRDGTLMRDVGYVNNPDDVVLTAGADEAVRLVNAAGWRAVVVTNQSGIARGLITAQQYEKVKARLDELLAAGGATLDASYHCPHQADVTGPCACRKPGTLLYEQASRALNINLARSVGIGDRWRDLEPVMRLGGAGILVRGEGTTGDDLAQASETATIADSLISAVRAALTTPGSTRQDRTAPESPLRVAVLASGGGSNLQAILDYFGAMGGQSPLQVVLVASDRPAAGALQRARVAGIPTAVIADHTDGDALSQLLSAHHVQLIALAGYLRLLPRTVVAAWRGAVVNVHPALLPKFGGAGMYGAHVHRAVLAAGDAESGATVHFVDEQFDHGAVLEQARVAVDPLDTVDTLAARVLAAEHNLYPRALERLAREHQTSQL